MVAPVFGAFVFSPPPFFIKPIGFSVLLNTVVSHQDLRQQRLAQHCFWDEEEQILWIDCRQVFPELGVVKAPSWDGLMMSSSEIPEYPSQLTILAWSNFSQLSYWRKQIPKWVQESCALFESHQLKMLHYSGKYPQVLELLDHAPMLVWRLMCSSLLESEIVALMSGKRQQLVAQVGWPDRAEAVKFLRNLRLRHVNKHISEQVEVCLMDKQRLIALQSLPRINSMALSLASVFPALIGSRLHHALAQLPCRPMQCQSMVALLEDAYALAERLALPKKETAKIGECRYLVEVSRLYQVWLKEAVSAKQMGLGLVFSDHQKVDDSWLASLSETPKKLCLKQEWLELSQLQQHAWWLDYDRSNVSLVVWKDSEGIWSGLIGNQTSAEKQGSVLNPNIIRVRGEKNTLPSAKQLTALHLWSLSD